MTKSRLARFLPGWKSVSLAVLAAVLLILAFPDFEYWFLAWFALVPLMFAVELEKASVWRSFVTGWIFGTVFFYGTCWWLTYAPIHYAGFPPWLAYSGMVFVAAIAGLFPAIFAGILGRAAPPFRLLGLSRRAVRLGVHRVPALLADRE